MLDARCDSERREMLRVSSLKTFLCDLISAGRRILAIVYLLFFISFSLLGKGEDKNDRTEMPYSNVYSIVTHFVPTQLTAHVSTELRLVCDNKDIDTSDLRLVIESSNGVIPVVVNDDWSFRFPVREDLLKENPFMVANQPTGSMSIVYSCSFLKKRSVGPEIVPYSELMLPVTIWLEMMEEKESKQRGGTLQQFQGMLYKCISASNSIEIAIRAKDKDIVLNVADDGTCMVPFDPRLIVENPDVVLPSNSVVFSDYIGIWTNDKPQECDVEMRSSIDGNEDAAIETLNHWLTYYYLYPRPELSSSMIDIIEKYQEGMGETVSQPLLAFLSEIMREEKQVLPSLLEGLERRDRRIRNLILSAAWLANTKRARLQMEEVKKRLRSSDQILIEMLLARKPFDILEMNISEASQLDMLWAVFFASGDVKYIERILSTLIFLQDKSDPLRLLVGGAARWSLQSNAEQHALVLEICRKRGRKEKGELKAVIGQIVAEAEGKELKADISSQIIEKLKNLECESGRSVSEEDLDGRR